MIIIENLVKSPLNYVGGKYKLLPQILPRFPSNIDTFVDLFSGGSNVGVNVQANRIFCNDILTPVISLMNYLKENETDYILQEIESLINTYGFTKTSEFGYEHYNCNSSDGVAKINKETYLKLRNDYNSGDKRDIVFYTLVAHSFSNNIRFNSKGEFNVAVNKRDFNDAIKNNLIKFTNKLKELNIKFTNKDFREIQIHKLKQDDFVYIDPPYLITVANYNENGGWTEKDEFDLLELMDKLNENKIKFALSNVLEHKGKTNEILINWTKNYTIHDLDKDYKNSNYQTNKREIKTSREVLITNY